MLPKFPLYVMEWFLGEVQKGAKEKGDASREVFHPGFIIIFKNGHFVPVMAPPLFHLPLYGQ
jgi:hypothetical protein